MRILKETVMADMLYLHSTIIFITDYPPLNIIMDNEKFKSKLKEIGKVTIVDNNKKSNNRALNGHGTTLFELDTQRTCERCGKETTKQTLLDIRRVDGEWVGKCGACRIKFKNINDAF